MTATARQRILLIEDDEDSGLMLRYLLELGGHEVQLARDGIKGLAAAAAWRPQIVISDLGLPGALDGYDVARQLRFGQVCPPAYLVALSGRGLDEDKARARAAGFHVHVTKPVDAEALEEIVARAVKRRSTRAERPRRAAARP